MKAFRLALRDEHGFWVAYLAPLDSMEGATEIGRIRMSVVRREPLLKTAFMELSKLAIGVVCDDANVPIQGWDDPNQAPPHERMQ